MKINYHTKSRGLCKSCGATGQHSRIETKGKRKGEKFVNHSYYYKVFEEVSVFRGDDELLGTYCKECFKNKPWLNPPGGGRKKNGKI